MVAKTTTFHSFIARKPQSFFIVNRPVNFARDFIFIVITNNIDNPKLKLIDKESHFYISNYMLYHVIDVYI